MTLEQITIPANKRLCDCGCGGLIDKADNRGRERFYKKGHAACCEETRKKLSSAHKGKKFSEESRQKMSQSKKGQRLGQKHHNWKGDDVKYWALHEWVRKYKAKPVNSLCEFCNLKPYEELACVTGQYNREFTNYKFLCKICHRRFDGQKRKHKAELKLITYVR